MTKDTIESIEKINKLIDDPEHKLLIRFEIDGGEGFSSLHGAYYLEKGVHREIIIEEAMAHFKAFLRQCIKSEASVEKSKNS